jgi:two-component system, NarL family, response regulator NreC
MPKTRVFVADDHAVLRAGLRLLINTQKDMEVVGEAGNHQEVLSKVRQLRPDVVTLDLSMPSGTGAMVIKTLAQELPQTRVVVLTMHDDPAYFRMAMAAGAFGYVVKKAADSELLDAIRCVARGRVFTQVELSSDCRTPPSIPQPTPRPLDSLSNREREVLVLIAQGYTNQAVADRLHLSVKTVESYRARLMAKLGLCNRAELTQLAIDTGLLAPSQTPD